MVDRTKTLFVLVSVLATLGLVIAHNRQRNPSEFHAALAEWIETDGEGARLDELRRGRETFVATRKTILCALARGDIDLPEATDFLMDYAATHYPMFLHSLRVEGPKGCAVMTIRFLMARNVMFHLLDGHPVADVRIDALLDEWDR